MQRTSLRCARSPLTLRLCRPRSLCGPRRNCLHSDPLEHAGSPLRTTGDPRRGRCKRSTGALGARSHLVRFRSIPGSRSIAAFAGRPVASLPEPRSLRAGRPTSPPSFPVYRCICAPRPRAAPQRPGPGPLPLPTAFVAHRRLHCPPSPSHFHVGPGRPPGIPRSSLTHALLSSLQLPVPRSTTSGLAA